MRWKVWECVQCVERGVKNPIHRRVGWGGVGWKVWRSVL